MKAKYKNHQFVAIEVDGKRVVGSIYSVNKLGSFKNPGEVTYNVYVPSLNTMFAYVDEISLTIAK